MIYTRIRHLKLFTTVMGQITGIILCILPLSVAQAQDQNDPVYKEMSDVDFSEFDVEGPLKKVPDTHTPSPGCTSRELLAPRVDFLHEVFESLKDIH